MKQSIFNIIATMIGLTLIPTALLAGVNDWHDTFYQYRIPLVVDFSKSGWHSVAVEETALVSAINRLEEMQYDPLWFDYNRLKVVEVDATGRVINSNPSAGFYMMPRGKELVNSSVIGKEKKVSVSTEAIAFYFVTYTYEGANRYYSPVGAYEPILPTPLRKSQYQVSYEPKMLPKGVNHREVLLLSDGSPLELAIESAYVTGLRDICLTEVDIRFIAQTERPGRRFYMLYYQPHNGYHLIIPQRRHSEVPASKLASVVRLGTAEKYLGNTQYQVRGNDHYHAWFAETTVKLTPNTQPPVPRRSVITISAAANEKQSFQLVLNPKHPFTFNGVTVSELTHGGHTISASQMSVYEVDYVPITRSSDITPVVFSGMMGDALVAPRFRTVSPLEGNVVLWCTVSVPTGTSAGTYKGTITVSGASDTALTVPLEVEVYNFELPEFSTFRSSMGGAHLTKTLSGQLDGKNIADYHHAKTESEIRQLAHQYYALMAKHKFTPHNALQYTPIGMNWSPPPAGFNADAPGNFFSLHDWDFTEFNKAARYFIDELKVNNFTLIHTNPSIIQIFKHLPGNKLKKYDRYPIAVTKHWQIFHEATWVGLRPGENNPYTYIEISQAQYDKLIMDFYRTIAENLEQNGWLDYVYILADETYFRGFDEYLHFLRLLKSNPLTARIRIAWCLQSANAYTYRDPSRDDAYAFHGLIDHYMPDWRENYNWWEKHFFTDYDIEPKREKLWTYNTHTTRSAIDTPGVNNRATALHVFNEGGSGFLRWSTFDWDRYRCKTDNPWTNPWTDICNGAMSYFYPPRKDGLASDLDLTVIPSLRVMTHREGVDDYEYAKMLEDLILAGEQKGVDVSKAKVILSDINRFFYNSVHWSQNDAWYLELRERIAGAIVELNENIG